MEQKLLAETYVKGLEIRAKAIKSELDTFYNKNMFNKNVKETIALFKETFDLKTYDFRYNYCASYPNEITDINFIKYCKLNTTNLLFPKYLSSEDFINYINILAIDVPQTILSLRQ